MDIYPRLRDRSDPVGLDRDQRRFSHGRSHSDGSGNGHALDVLSKPQSRGEQQYPHVAIGWATAFWQIMQILIIILATTHGYNGLRVVIEDFMGDTYLRPMLRGLIFLLWLFSLIVAIYVILSS